MTNLGYENMLKFILFGEPCWKPYQYHTFEKGDRISFSVNGGDFNLTSDPSHPSTEFRPQYALGRFEVKTDCYLAVAQFDRTTHKMQHVDFMSKPFRMTGYRMDEDYMDKIVLHEQCKLLWFFIWGQVDSPSDWDINGRGWFGFENDQYEDTNTNYMLNKLMLDIEDKYTNRSKKQELDSLRLRLLKMVIREHVDVYVESPHFDAKIESLIQD